MLPGGPDACCVCGAAGAGVGFVSWTAARVNLVLHWLHRPERPSRSSATLKRWPHAGFGHLTMTAMTGPLSPPRRGGKDLRVVERALGVRHDADADFREVAVED